MENRRERRRQERQQRKASGETNIRRHEDAEHHQESSKSFKSFSLKPRNDEQRKYINLIKNMDLVVATGGAGVGKSFVAAVMAAQMLANRDIDTIYIVRPNVPLGREIGFVKGTMLEKMAMWIAPVLDGFEAVFSKEYINILLEKEIIRVVPVSYLRGRTFRNSFVILDEAEDLERNEMECFLQRIGEGSKTVISGDIAQKDIKTRSGLEDLVLIADSYENVPFGFIELEENVRSDLSSFFCFAYKDLNLTESDY